MALLQLTNHSARSVLRYRAAYRHLAKADPVMGRLIAQLGECTLKPRRNYFAVLCDAIIAQQLSIAVADVIYRRFQKLFPGCRPSPQAVLRISSRQLRTVGLSRQKISYLQDLARVCQRPYCSESALVTVRRRHHRGVGRNSRNRSVDG